MYFFDTELVICLVFYSSPEISANSAINAATLESHVTTERSKAYRKNAKG